MAKSKEVTFNDRDLRNYIKLVQKKFSKTKKAEEFAKQISPIIFKDVIKHFEEEKGPEGDWSPWSDIYEEHMDRVGKGSNRILQDNGKLRQTFSAKKYRKIDSGFEWYNNSKTRDGFPYAFAHNEGGKILPERRFMWLSDEGLALIAKTGLRYIKGKK